MKIQVTTTSEKITSPSLGFDRVKIIGDLKIRAKVRLSDPCKNGHEDFNVTGETWRKNKKGKWEEDSFGCIHETILEVWPDLAPLVRLHLHDMDGCPMHTARNGLYFLKEGKREILRDSYFLTGEEIEKLERCDIEDTAHFSFLLEQAGLRERMKEAAQAAIGMIEKENGSYLFKSEATRKNWPRLTDEEEKEIWGRIQIGYYSPEQVAERKADRETRQRAKLLQELEEAREEKSLELELDYLLKRATLDVIGLTTGNNCIFYKHTGEIVGNWQEGSYARRISAEEFEKIATLCRASHPDFSGVKFTLKA